MNIEREVKRMSEYLQEDNLCLGDLIRECNCDDCPFDNKPFEWSCCSQTVKNANILVSKLGAEIQKLQAQRKIIVDKFLSE